MMKAVIHRSQSRNSRVLQNKTLLNPIPLHPFLQASILDLAPHCRHRFLKQLKLNLFHNSRQEHGVQEVQLIRLSDPKDQHSKPRGTNLNVKARDRISRSKDKRKISNRNSNNVLPPIRHRLHHLNFRLLQLKIALKLLRRSNIHNSVLPTIRHLPHRLKALHQQHKTAHNRPALPM